MTKTKNSGCCCGKCWERGECEPIYSGHTQPAGFVRDSCCKCFPKRICVHLDLYEYGIDLPTKTVSIQSQYTCNNQIYSGTLNDADITSIDFYIYYTKDSFTGQCYLAFESSALGYTGAYILLYPMGGTYAENSVKRLECDAFNWEFAIDIGSNAIYRSDAVIRITEDDLTTLPRNCEDENMCYAPKACITYTDSNGDTQTDSVCVTVDGEYITSFTDPVTYEVVSVNISLVDWSSYTGTFCGSAPALSLTSSIDASRTSSKEVVADCPNMEAEWTFYEGVSISIKKDPRYYLEEFSDCRCICRCLCVTRIDEPLYATPPPQAYTGTACMEHLLIAECGYRWIRGWHVTLTNVADPYDTQEVYFWLEYNCETESTYMYTSLSDTPILLECPNLASLPGTSTPTNIEWIIVPGGGAQPYVISVKCVACATCELGGVTTPCCPDRELPATLNIEVTSSLFGCTNLVGETGTLIWNGDSFDPIWTGFLFGTEWILTCGGVCGTDWCLTGCGTFTMQGGNSCDPFQLEFCGGGGCAQCDDPAMSDFCVTITE